MRRIVGGKAVQGGIALTETMVGCVERYFDFRPKRLAGNTPYGAARQLKWLVDRNIGPHVPVWHKSARQDGSFSRTGFVFDPGATSASARTAQN